MPLGLISTFGRGWLQRDSRSDSGIKGRTGWRFSRAVKSNRASLKVTRQKLWQKQNLKETKQKHHELVPRSSGIVNYPEESHGKGSWNRSLGSKKPLTGISYSLFPYSREALAFGPPPPSSHPREGSSGPVGHLGASVYNQAD